ncbi:MAG: YicC family protein [Deltaproteobacteria bacterium]|nr:MAG: YicC family protein [Deltaproteobacteria bacterium]
MIPMLRSMTGFGRGEAASADVTVVVELRSVNNRFRDLQLRTPREYMPLEPRINNLLKEPFARGRIDAFVRRSASGSKSRVAVDAELAKAYVTAAHAVSEVLPEGSDGAVPLTWVVSQPGVLEVTEVEADVMTEWDVVETALTAAVEDLVRMREVEGQALYADLLSHLGELRTAVAEVEAVAVGLNERLRQRLEARLTRLLGDRGLDKHRLHQEAAVLADKADVSEEIARLRSHCDQFADALDDDEPVGRRLDFILQEMNREVNTIGSKSVDHPISHRVVTMKSVLERMREQAANVE